MDKREKDMAIDRRIKLDSIPNLRDLGGIRTTDGRVIRRGMLLRSAHLHDAGAEDMGELKDSYHLKKVIDLRTPFESGQKPDVKSEGVECLMYPVFRDEVLGITHGKQTGVQELEKKLPSMENMYSLLALDEHACEMISAVLHEIMEHEYESGSVLWHCTEGKDRCGVISALTLLALHVDQDTVYEDYLMTNETNDKKSKMLYEKLIAEGKSEEFALAVSRMYLAKREYLDAFFRTVETKYGSVDRFFSEKLGIPETLRAHFRKNVTVEESD